MTRQRQLVDILPVAVVSVVSFYLLFPLLAGTFATHDCRGPKIYLQQHHTVLYRIGYVLFHGGKPRVPREERAWFYGLRGKRYPSPPGWGTRSQTEVREE